MWIHHTFVHELHVGQGGLQVTSRGSHPGLSVSSPMSGTRIVPVPATWTGIVCLRGWNYILNTELLELFDIKCCLISVWVQRFDELFKQTVFGSFRAPSSSKKESDSFLDPRSGSGILDPEFGKNFHNVLETLLFLSYQQIQPRST